MKLVRRQRRFRRLLTEPAGVRIPVLRGRLLAEVQRWRIDNQAPPWEAARAAEGLLGLLTKEEHQCK